MKFDVVIGDIREYPAQAIAVNLFEGVAEPSGAAAAVDQALDGALTALITEGDFRGKANEVAVLYTRGALAAPRVFIVGLGKPEQFDIEGARRAAATVARKARDLGVKRLATIVHGAGAGGIAPEKAAEAVVEGTLLGLYRFHELRTQLEDARPDLESLTLVDCAPDNQAAVELGVESGRILAESTVLARNLINRPANVATPSHIVETARAMAADVGLACRVMEKPEMEARGMHSLLSVNQGGGEPARMVILQHNGDREELPTITLVGKGITFDSGGISLKPGQDMWKMKGDMGGAAAVIGAMRAVALLNLPLRVIGLTPLTENMPDAFASKPGDVVKSLKGLTIEIISTDAEGRMILADALTYSGTFKPDAIVDVATLTGSKVIALGAQAAAVMGDDTLIEKLRAAGNATFERVWPMPMYKEYAEELKSDFADVKHVGSRAGGCITAGVFLSKFPPDGIPWAHLDIAGHAFAEKDTPYVPKGAVGFGVRLLVEMLRSWD